MNRIQEEAREWVRENGNVNIKYKDMAIYIIKKLDRIEDKLDGKVDKKAFWTIVSALAVFGMFILKELFNIRLGGLI